MGKMKLSQLGFENYTEKDLFIYVRKTTAKYMDAHLSSGAEGFVEKRAEAAFCFVSFTEFKCLSNSRQF